MGVINKVSTIDQIEVERLRKQLELDSSRTQAERNQLGQFATPPQLATEIVEYAKTFRLNHQLIHFLDPAFGTGAFYSALIRSFSSTQIAKAVGVEIDPHYGHEAIKLWEDTPLELKIADFTQLPPPALEEDKANLLICNPPYVRHHHLPSQEKLRLQQIAWQATGIKLKGLTGLYCYFLLIAHKWLAENGLACWLIPSEFMDVNYGEPIKRYLLQQVTLLRVHRFDPNEVQFEDALVSSAIVWLQKAPPPSDHQIEFSYGGTLVNPKTSKHFSREALQGNIKWSGLPTTPPKTTSNHPGFKLGDLFEIKRGLVTGANKFFILNLQQIADYQLPARFLRPILPSPRYLLEDIVEADQSGTPVLSQNLFLLDCSLPEAEIKTDYPSLWYYLQIGKHSSIDEGYICRHRSPWYSQEYRPAAPLLCTYMGRQTSRNGKPFRFILNYSQATAPNVYLMLYPTPTLNRFLQGKPGLLKQIWEALNSISPTTLIHEGRLYGGGLHKIEPGELGNAPADSILAILPELADTQAKQLSLFS